MKKFLSAFFALATLILVCTPAFAAETNAQPYTIIVGGQTLDLSDLPCAPYREGDTIMVPLRKIGETLGYKVDWDAQTGVITIDDEYIQKATLYNGAAEVTFEGHLKIINMSREVENSVETVIHDGYTYIPLEFFQEFFNDVEIDGFTITIAPSMCELDA